MTNNLSDTVKGKGRPHVERLNYYNEEIKSAPDNGEVEYRYTSNPLAPSGRWTPPSKRKVSET